LEERLQNFIEYHQEKNTQALEEHFEQEMAEEDKYLDAAIHLLKEEGELTPEEADRLKVISDKIDSLFKERHSDVEKMFNSLGEEAVSEEDPDKVQFSFKQEDPKQAEINSVMIYDKDDNEYGILSWEKGDDLELELLDEEETTYLINQVFLEDLPVSELKTLCKDIGIKYSHNSKDVTLAKKLVQFFEEIVNE